MSETCLGVAETSLSLLKEYSYACPAERSIHPALDFLTAFGITALPHLSTGVDIPLLLQGERQYYHTERSEAPMLDRSLMLEMTLRSGMLATV